MNLAIFERIEVGPEAEITGTTLTPVYKALSAWQPGLGQPKTRRKATKAQDRPRTANVRPLFAPVHWLGLLRRSAKAALPQGKRQRTRAKRRARKTADLRESGGVAVAKRSQLARGWVACDPILDAGVADMANRRGACPSRRKPLVDPSVVGRCRSCGRRLYGRGKVCRSRRCPEYGPVWAGDQRQKLFRNLETLRGDILLSAVTAPGADELPWDEQACAALGEHKHSGKLGCRVA